MGKKALKQKVKFVSIWEMKNKSFKNVWRNVKV